jgi:hypothetical protein
MPVSLLSQIKNQNDKKKKILGVVGQKLPNRPESDETEKEFDCWVVVSRVTG